MRSRLLSIIILCLLISNQEILTISKKERLTIEYYNKNAIKWISNSSIDNDPYEELKIFQEYLPSGSIFEIGVGGAQEASYFINKGYKYTGIDPAENLIDGAIQKSKNGIFLVNTVYDFDLPTNSFDGFWCSATLLHIPKNTIDLALNKIRQVMKANAIGFISIVEGQGEYFEKGRYFYLYSKNEFEDILKKNGLTVLKHYNRKKDTTISWLENWLIFFVKVNN